MAERLFRERNFSEWHDGLIASERMRFDGFKLNILESPAIDTLIENAGNGIISEVPTLIRDKMQGRAALGTMSITIPFSGNFMLFRICPTSSTLIPNIVTVNKNELIIEFPDNDRVKGELDDFINSVQINLANLAKDIERSQEELRSFLQGYVKQRIAAIKAKSSQDQSLGFPVQRD